MAIEYLALTEAERDLMLAEALWGHERQHFAYEQQIAHESALLEELPKGEWPEELRYLKGLGRDQLLTAAKSPEDAALGSSYAQRDFLRGRCEAAKVERTRTEGYHREVVKALPTERRAAAITAARTKREAAEEAVSTRG